MSSIKFQTVTFKVKHNISAQLLNGKLRNSLEESLQQRYHGTCFQGLYIRPKSLKLVSKSIGQLRGSHFRGEVTYDAVFTAETFKPINNSAIYAKVLSKNASGILARSPDVPMDIFMISSHHRKGDAFVPEFDIVEVGDPIVAKILQYEVRYNQIYAIGQLIEISQESHIDKQVLKLDPINITDVSLEFAAEKAFIESLKDRHDRLMELQQQYYESPDLVKVAELFHSYHSVKSDIIIELVTQIQGLSKIKSQITLLNDENAMNVLQRYDFKNVTNILYDTVDGITSLLDQTIPDTDVLVACLQLTISPEDFQNAEFHYYPYLIAQILLASSIKADGTLILMVNDMFTLPTEQLIAVVTTYFDQAELFKPLSSPLHESNKYVLATGFKKSEFSQNRKILDDYFDQKQPNKYLSTIVQAYVKSPVDIQVEFVDKQIKHLEKIIDYTGDLDTRRLLEKDQKDAKKQATWYTDKLPEQSAESDDENEEENQVVKSTEEESKKDESKKAETSTPEMESKELQKTDESKMSATSTTELASKTDELKIEEESKKDESKKAETSKTEVTSTKTETSKTEVDSKKDESKIDEDSTKNESQTEVASKKTETTPKRQVLPMIPRKKV